MEASKMFCDIITKIENSHLNYRILKTPFSANISIKSSFVKYFDGVEPEHLEIPVKMEEDEIIKLASDLSKAKSEMEKLQEINRQEKTRVSTLEKQIGDYREELVNIKKEKKKLNSDLERYRNGLEDIKVEKSCVEEARNDLKDKLKVKSEALKVKDIDSAKHRKEYSLLEKQLEELILKVKSEENEKSSKLKKKEMFKCDNCDIQHDSFVLLREHIRSTHHKNQVSQTKLTEVKSEFAEYACFYCSRQIMCVKDLEEHKAYCYTIKDFTLYPCSTCGAQCPDEATLGRHRTIYHDVGTFSKELGVDFFYCDVCPSNYRSRAELRGHISCTHDEEFG